MWLRDEGAVVNTWKAPGGNRGICSTAPASVPLVGAISVVVCFRSLPLAAFGCGEHMESPRWKPGNGGPVPASVPLVEAISVVVCFRSLPLAAFRVWGAYGKPPVETGGYAVAIG